MKTDNKRFVNSMCAVVGLAIASFSILFAIRKFSNFSELFGINIIFIAIGFFIFGFSSKYFFSKE